MFASCRPKTSCVLRRASSSDLLEVFRSEPELKDRGLGPERLQRRLSSCVSCPESLERKSEVSPAKPGGIFAACKKPRSRSPDSLLDAKEGAPKKDARGPAAQSLPTEDDLDSTEDGYLRLEDEDADQTAEHLLQDLADMRKQVDSLRVTVVALCCAATVLASGLLLLVYRGLGPEDQRKVQEGAIDASIPLVALFFTWFHIWLAIQMMFKPIQFVGLQFGSTGLGLGWQGVVPRKASKMAASSYDCARPYLEGPADWLGRVDPRGLVAKIRPQLEDVIVRAMSSVVATHMPRTDRRLPDSIRRRIAVATVDRVQQTSPQLWRQMSDLICDPKLGIDNENFLVKIFTSNKELLNHFFLTLGAREFRFIEHCGAAMGFMCGAVQLVAFRNLSPSGRAVFLPCSGFFLGILSNWLAIRMVFKPTRPYHIRIGNHLVYTLQGLFLKRQQDVAVLYSKLLCDHFLSFNIVVEYLQSCPELWECLRAAYVAHSTKTLRETLGIAASWLVPVALGKEQAEALEEDLEVALVQGLYNAEAIHEISGRYIGKVSDVERRNCRALQKMPPEEFENLLHPVFQEDEWILIVLGGFLGTIVGVAQVFFLSN